jgi:hypothetical protein
LEILGIEMKKELSERVKGLRDKDFSNPETQREIHNMFEFLSGMIEAQAAETQALKDKMNRLKNEKSKPHK